MSSGIMQRWVLTRSSGGRHDLVSQHVPVPEPGPGQVRMRVHAAALDRRDLLVRDGRADVRAASGLVPLGQGAGVVDAVGHGVDRWAPGDRVVSVFLGDWPDGAPGPHAGHGLGSGGEDGLLAEYVVLPADRVTGAPAGVSLAEAATLPTAGLTAWTALRGNRPYARAVLAPGDTVLVVGDSGVALYAAQLAAAWGATVWAVARGPASTELWDAVGVVGSIDCAAVPHWGRRVHDRTGGAQVVVDCSGGASLSECLAAVARGGEVACTGPGSPGVFDAVPNLRTLLDRGASLRGADVGSRAALDDLVLAVDELGLEPMLGRVVDFADAPAAYDHLDGHEASGHVVVEVVAATECEPVGRRAPTSMTVDSGPSRTRGEE